MKANNLSYKFYIINTICTIIVLSYLGYRFLANQGTILAYTSFIGLIIVLIYNRIITRERYKEHDKLRLFGMVVNLFVFSWALISNDFYIVVFGMLIFIMVMIEIVLIVILINYNLTKLRIIMYGFVLFNLIMRYFYVGHYNNLDIVLSIIFLVMLSLILFIIEENFKESIKMIQSQNELIINSDRAFRALDKVQKQVIIDNNTLKKKKSELERENDDISRANAEMFIQNELVRYISTTIDIKQLMNLVTDSIIGAVGVDICSLIIINSEGLKQRINVKSSLNLDLEGQLEESLEKGELDRFFDLRNAHVDGNVDVKDYPFIKNRDTNAIIMIPLYYEEEFYGLLIAEKMGENPFSSMSIQFFENIGQQINIAIRNAKFYMIMANMANMDYLTKLYNRRYMQETVIKLMGEAKSDKMPLTVALFDIDHFKKINDTYGHIFGDEALKVLAKLTLNIAKKHDVIAGRYGGEEFILVFKNREIKEVYKIVEELQEKIKSENLVTKHNEIVKIDISSGISSFPEYALTVDELLVRADNAMYYSKEHGRGRITADSYELTK